MDELIKQITQKTGLSEEMAKTVVGIVLDFVKDKLPAPIAGQIDGLLKGGSAAGGLGALGGLGGLLGKKK